MTQFLKSTRVGGLRQIERAQKRQLSFCNGACGGWLSTRRASCPQHHGNKERPRLKEREDQGLHLFQQHFNYSGQLHSVAQTHSRTGRNSRAGGSGGVLPVCIFMYLFWTRHAFGNEKTQAAGDEKVWKPSSGKLLRDIGKEN